LRIPTHRSSFEVIGQEHGHARVFAPLGHGLIAIKLSVVASTFIGCGLPGPVHTQDAHQDATHGAGRALSVQSLLKDVHAKGTSQTTPTHSQSRQAVQMSALRLQVFSCLLFTLLSVRRTFCRFASLDELLQLFEYAGTCVAFSHFCILLLYDSSVRGSKSSH